MRHFEFELQVPDGRTFATGVAGFTWPEAFSRACAGIERSFGIEPDSGIVCRSYRSTRQPEPVASDQAA